MKQKILFLHGGPTMNSDYFMPWFEPLSKSCELVFYDQKGTCVNDLHKQLKQEISKNRMPHIVAHSWGAYLILSALNEGIIDKSDIESLILIAPMPLTDQRCEYGIELRKSRFPNSVCSKIDTIWDTNDLEQASKDYIAIITPYYHHDPSFDMGGFPPFDRQTAKQINDEIKGFDLRSVLRLLPKKTLLIYGASDFFQPDPEYKATFPGYNIHVIDNAGHYVFAEAQNETMKIIEEFLEGKAD